MEQLLLKCLEKYLRIQRKLLRMLSQLWDGVPVLFQEKKWWGKLPQTCVWWRVCCCLVASRGVEVFSAQGAFLVSCSWTSRSLCWASATERLNCSNWACTWSAPSESAENRGHKGSAFIIHSAQKIGICKQLLSETWYLLASMSKFVKNVQTPQQPHHRHHHYTTGGLCFSKSERTFTPGPSHYTSIQLYSF